MAGMERFERSPGRFKGGRTAVVLHPNKMAVEEGFEPSTCRFRGACTGQLCYSTIWTTEPGSNRRTLV